MATISFEVPDDELGKWQEQWEFRRGSWATEVSREGVYLILPRAALAALDYPLPPKVEVGAKVRWGGPHFPVWKVECIAGPNVFLTYTGDARTATILNLDDLPEGFEVLERAQ